MKISSVNSPTRFSFSQKPSSPKKNEKNCSLNFGNNNSIKISAALLAASALIGLLIYLGLAPQGKKDSTKDLHRVQKQPEKNSLKK